MISFLTAALKIIILLGFLIFIHELGHFTVAKLCKVKINQFAIGFGPAIWQKQGKETKYAIRLIPLGGFVSMEGESEQSEDERSFSKASIPKRFAIVAAGAIVNIVFAIIVYFALFMSAGPYVTNIIDGPIPDTAAEQIGLQANDEIIEINGRKIKKQKDINYEIGLEKGKEVNIKIKRNNEIIEFKNIQTTGKEYETTTGKVTIYYLGVNLKQAPDTFKNRLISGGIYTEEIIGSAVESIKQLVTGKTGIDQMSGIVGISDVIVKTNGILEFIQILAIISLSLGVTNLLPIPALDGGKLLILIIEAIRRKPLKPEIEMNIQLIGFSILIGLSIFITYKDIVRIF